MRKSITLFCLIFGGVIYAQEATTFILVRHAEKASDGTRNPPLSEAGVERANELMNLLSSTDVTAIYSTGYTRTRTTVEPLAEAKKLTIQEYSWGDPKALLSGILQKNWGGTVVISGHSNTTPFLANVILGEEKFEQFDDSDYGNLLVIVATELGSGKLLHLRF